FLNNASSLEICCFQCSEYILLTFRELLSIQIFFPVSASLNITMPIGGNSVSRSSYILRATTSCLLLATERAISSDWFSSKKSEIIKTVHFFLMALVIYRTAWVISVPVCWGWKSISSLIMCSIWLLPFFGGMNFSIVSEKKITP